MTSLPNLKRCPTPSCNSLNTTGLGGSILELIRQRQIRTTRQQITTHQVSHNHSLRNPATDHLPMHTDSRHLQLNDGLKRNQSPLFPNLQKPHCLVEIIAFPQITICKLEITPSAMVGEASYLKLPLQSRSYFYTTQPFFPTDMRGTVHIFSPSISAIPLFLSNLQL